jgi:PPOX class probable F420-dependent enzyme
LLSEEQLAFLQAQRVATLATADASGAPHAVPVCFLAEPDKVYIAIDEKPKRVEGRNLKRLRNIAENPQVALVADHYDDGEWSQLGWVMVRGRADIIEEGQEYARAQSLLKAQYPQYLDMALERLPVIAVRIERVTSWGDLKSTIC